MKMTNEEKEKLVKEFAAKSKDIKKRIAEAEIKQDIQQYVPLMKEYLDLQRKAKELYVET